MNRKRLVAVGLTVAVFLLAHARVDRRRAAAVPPANAVPVVHDSGGLRWFKGNLHTHSLWSDGDDFPERIAVWYRDRGYHFLTISDHNNLQQGERWKRFSDLKKKGAGPAVGQYLKDFSGLAKTRGDDQRMQAWTQPVGWERRVGK